MFHLKRCSESAIRDPTTFALILPYLAVFGFRIWYLEWSDQKHLVNGLFAFCADIKIP